MLWLVLASALAITAIAISACSSPPVPTVGDDELVGRPGPAPETSEAPPQRRGALWYHIEAKEQGIAIQLRLLQPPPRATFFLPGSWAGNHYDDLFTLHQAHGPDSIRSMTVDRSEGRIDVDAAGAEWIELSYQIQTRARPDEKHRFFPWGSADAFFAYVPTILLLPSAGVARQLRDIPVEVHAPADWTVAATWQQPQHLDSDTTGEQKVVGFVADDIRSLRDAFVAGARDWEQLNRSLPGGDLALYVTEEFSFDSRELADATETITGEYLARFDGYDHISALLFSLPDDAPDSLRGTGRHGGFVLEVPADQQLDDELLLLLAHEALHMWNGHQLVPATDYRDQGRWFKEGVTHYIALKTLARLDLIDERTVRRELAMAGRLYRQNPIVAGGPIRDMDRTRFPYDYGLLIALALDLSLLRHTGGALSIEDWLITLLASPFAQAGRAYDDAVLRDGFEYMLRDFDPEPLRRYDELVTSSTELDVSALFRDLGLHFLTGHHDKRSRLLPLDDDRRDFDILFNRSPFPPGRP